MPRYKRKLACTLFINLVCGTLPKQNSVDLEQFFGPQKMEKRLNVGLRNKYTLSIVGTASSFFFWKEI